LGTSGRFALLSRGGEVRALDSNDTSCLYWKWLVYFRLIHIFMRDARACIWIWKCEGKKNAERVIYVPSNSEIPNPLFVLCI